MRMIYLTQYFASPSQAGSGRPWQSVSHFGQSGNRVHAIISNLDYNTGRPRQGRPTDHDQLPPSVTLHLVGALGFGKSLAARLVQYLSYTIMACWKGLSFQKIDVVLASSPPDFCRDSGLPAGFV